MGIREELEHSPRALRDMANDEAVNGDSKFWDWLVTQPEWVDLVERYAERRVGEHYLRVG